MAFRGASEETRNSGVSSCVRMRDEGCADMQGNHTQHLL